MEELEHPSIEEGKVMVGPKPKKKKRYEAYGSDDMMETTKPKKKFFGDKLESGKKVFGKIGGFFSKQVKNLGNIRLKKPAEKKKKEETVEEGEEVREEKKGVISGFTNNMANVGGKIGGTLRKLSSKTIDLASGTTNFIKKQSSNLIINKNEATLKTEIIQEDDKYKKYLDDSPSKNQNEEQEPKTEEEDKIQPKYNEFIREDNDPPSSGKKERTIKKEDSISEDDDVYLI